MIRENAVSKAEVRREDTLRALNEIRESARVNGLSDIPLDEINAEIQKARSELDGCEA